MSSVFLRVSKKFLILETLYMSSDFELFYITLHVILGELFKRMFQNFYGSVYIYTANFIVQSLGNVIMIIF